MLKTYRLEKYAADRLEYLDNPLRLRINFQGIEDSIANSLV